MPHILHTWSGELLPHTPPSPRMPLSHLFFTSSIIDSSALGWPIAISRSGCCCCWPPFPPNPGRLARLSASPCSYLPLHCNAGIWHTHTHTRAGSSFMEQTGGGWGSVRARLSWSAASSVPWRCSQQKEEKKTHTRTHRTTEEVEKPHKRICTAGTVPPLHTFSRYPFFSVPSVRINRIRCRLSKARSRERKGSSRNRPRTRRTKRERKERENRERC